MATPSTSGDEMKHSMTKSWLSTETSLTKNVTSEKADQSLWKNI